MIVRKYARLRAMLKLAIAALIIVLLPAAASAMKFYVDNTLGEVTPDQKVAPADPKPVQLLFEFQRDGAPNPRATKLVKPWALEDLQALGVFTDVVEKPVPGGAVLSIKFNNVVNEEELKKVKKDAFGAGLGFGLFGGVMAADHYVVTLEYIPADGSAPVSTEVQHVLYSTYGKQKKDFVAPGTEVKKANDAVKLVVRQALARGVNNIFAQLASPGGVGKTVAVAHDEQPAATAAGEGPVASAAP